MKTAVFVLGTPEYQAVKKGEALTNATLKMLDDITNDVGIDAELVFVSLEGNHAGKAKSKLGMKYIREQRGRVLDEIGAAKPDLVVCFGPVATACVFGKGNLPEAELLRKAHYPLGEDQPPVHVTFSIEAVGWKAGLARWLHMDVHAAVHGMVETEWGHYTVTDPHISADWDTAPEWVASAHVVGFDLETYPGLDPWHPDARIRMCVISDQEGRAHVVQATQDSKFPEWLVELAANPLVVKVGSNIKFDYRWMRRFGYALNNMDCTSMREHIIDESNPKKDLKSLTFKYCPKLGDYSRGHRDLVRERGGWEFIDDDEMYEYCGGDGEASIASWRGQEERIANDFERPHRLFKRLYSVLGEIEHRGWCVDMAANARLDDLYQSKLSGLRAEITVTLGPINLNSPTQLAKALKEAVPDIKLSLYQWKKALSDDEDESAVTKREVLEREAHKHPVIPLVLEFRKYRTRHSTFIKGIKEKYAVEHSGGTYIHPTYRVDVVETYRLSSQQPNGQNYPRKDNDDPDLTVKQQFISRFKGGKILEGDQSQVEIRVAAWLSQDKNMLAAIESGEDIHTSMASIMLDKPIGEITEQEREECKHRTFLILYGGGAQKLATDLQISRRKAQRMIDEYFETFNGLHRYIQKVKSQVRRDLYVETPFGFRRTFVEPERWESREGYRIERQAFNTIVQNTAACLTYLAMCQIEEQMRHMKLISIMTGQVHDSSIQDCHPTEVDIVAYLVKSGMESAGYLAQEFGVKFDVPLKCDIEVGESWGTVKPYAVTKKLGV